MKRIFTQAALLALLLAPLAGCSRLHYYAGQPKPVLANSAVARPHRVISQFKEKGHRYYAFWGLAPIGGLDGADLITARINQGDGVVNFNARERFSFGDQLLGLLTAGLFSSRSVEVSGAVFIYDPPLTTRPGPTVVVPPAGGTVVVPPKDGTIVVPQQQDGTVVVPPSGTVVVP